MPKPLASQSFVQAPACGANERLSVMKIIIHHRGTEITEEAQRFERLSSLRVISVLSVSLW